MSEFESFFAERGVQIYLSMRSWHKKGELEEQKKGIKAKQYFIRLKDENATITPPLIKLLA
jgi:hypothetical protein